MTSTSISFPPVSAPISKVGGLLNDPWLGWINEVRNVLAQIQSDDALLSAAPQGSDGGGSQQQTSQLSAVVAVLDNMVQRMQDLEVSMPARIEPPDLAYGAFRDSSSQTAAATNTAYAVTFGTQDFVYDTHLDVGNPSRVYVDRTGTFNVQFSAQMTKSTAAVGYAYIWVRVNGMDVPNSASRVAFQGSTSDTVPAWNFLIKLKAGDYVELLWAVSDTNVQITSVGATGFCPAIPSVIFTICEASL